MVKLKHGYETLETVQTTSSTATSIQRHLKQINTSRRSKSYRKQQTVSMIALCNNMLPLCVVFVISCLLQSVQTSPIFVDNPNIFQTGRNIRHLPCIVRKSGRSGVCMFAIDCIKQNGTHLGTCIDRFYFGSCCHMKDDASIFAPEISDNSIDQNTISHFAHESTTLATSALFKPTSSSTTTTTSTESNDVRPLVISEHLRNVTHSYLSLNRVETTPTSTQTKPVKLSSTSTPLYMPATTRRPPSQTTHKNSHFVVRTTAKPRPNIGAKPTAAPTTIKPPRRRITTVKPIIATTQGPIELRIETTTPPTKFVTFQIVETTTSTPTEATFIDETPTTRRPVTKPTRKRVPPTTTSKIAITSTTNSTVRPTPPLRTTNQFTTPSTTTTTTTTTISTRKPKPTTSRRPIPPVKPSSSKPPSLPSPSSSQQHTRKPIVNMIPTNATATNSPIQRLPTLPVMSTNVNNDEINTTFMETKVTERPTHAPRPRPKPTAEIVKVPALLADINGTTLADKTTRRPTTTTLSEAAATITTTPPAKPDKLDKPTKTTTTPTEAAASSSVSPPSSSPSSSFPSSSTTGKPGLITWTDIKAEPTTNATIASDWQPAPPSMGADWVPVPTVAPEGSNKTTSDTTEQNIDANASTSSSVISVATSISSSASKPEAPATTIISTSTTKPSSTTTTSSSSTSSPTKTTTIPITLATATATTSTPTSTKVPRPKPTKPPMTATSTTLETITSTSTPIQPIITTSTTTKTDEKPPSSTSSATPSPSSSSSSSSSTTVSAPSSINSEESEEESSTASVDYGTENIFGTGTGSTTLDYTNNEEYNATMDAGNTSTAAPGGSLEGIDYREVCGRRMFPEPRIVGGANAAFGRWPWQISLRQWRTSTYLHKCGAALLNENWAITAAHCVDNVPPSDLLLRLGEYDLAEEEEPYGYQERRVQIVASHPQFDPRTFEYDLALLRFYEPVLFQPNIIPVCVPENDENFIGQTAFVTGWGRLYEDGPLPSVLQEVAVPVINNTICESMYRSAGYIEHIPHIFICAGWKKGGYDSCEGDSGGPMVLQREKDKRFQLGGVISWGIGCAEANQPGVYTRISEFRDWINQILQF